MLFNELKASRFVCSTGTDNIDFALDKSAGIIVVELETAPGIAC